MARSRKRKVDNKPADNAPDIKAIENEQKRVRRTRYIISGVVIAVIAIIVFVSLYITSAPYRINVLIVDDTSIRMDYLIKRIKISGANALSTFDALTREQIIKLEAPNYGVEITEEDIDLGLRLIASGGSANLTESEFKEWYRQRLNETNLTESEYREITRTSLMAAELQEYFAQRVSTIAEQVHLHAILLADYEEAVKIHARWEEGEDFIDLFREVAGDEAAEEEGWDIGWFPEGVNELIDYVAFDLELNPGEVSDPLASEDEQYFYIFMAVDREVREIEENNLNFLKSQALETWYYDIIQLHSVSFHGLTNGYDSYTDAWINLQVLKD